MEKQIVYLHLQTRQQITCQEQKTIKITNKKIMTNIHLKSALAMLMLSWSSLTHAQNNVLWYDRPASHWVEALPLGNGRLGAMVYGGVKSDTIQLNEDTFWSGSPYNNVNPKALAVLPEIRAAIDSGDYQKAQYLSMHNITAATSRGTV